MGIGATAGAAAAGGIALTTRASSDTNGTSGTGGSESSSADALVFDKDAYSTPTTALTDAEFPECPGGSASFRAPSAPVASLPRA
ncbi:hypothetical protein [Streptomyces viridochromogenes]|uniref:Uncharacterized protein n=1 Tax=Streptomyces viridochromogenes Tue57 TaxID=1160705 RepID=L8PFD1_STRVR|nr:hypothetical protein [Streptomyces viridochromogenes]ELS54087.1 hypothetical protein STVIR_4970 [Streptomyces viridochromogenes Tue57]